MPVERARASVYDQGSALPKLRVRLIPEDRIHGSLGLRHDQHPFDLDFAIAAHLECSRHRLLQFRPTAHVVRHRQPEHQQVDPVDLHEMKRPGSEGSVLVRSHVVVVMVPTHEAVSRKRNVGAHLVPHAAHRHADRLALAPEGIARVVVRTVIGDRGEVGALGPSALRGHHVLGVPETHIDGSDDCFHGRCSPYCIDRWRQHRQESTCRQPGKAGRTPQLFSPCGAPRGFDAPLATDIH